MRRIRNPWVFLSSTLLSLLLVSGCSRQGLEAPQGGANVTPSNIKLQRAVELVQTQQKPLKYEVETIGYLEADQTDIAAGVAGIVDEVSMHEGDSVRAGTLLVKIDQKKYLAALEMSRANELRSLRAVALARETADRARSAGIGGSDEEKTKTLLTLQIAEAELASARASLSLAEQNYQRSQVRAPYRGQINQRRIATAGFHVEEKTVIATLADLESMRLVCWVPEKAAPTVRDNLDMVDAQSWVSYLGGAWVHAGRLQPMLAFPWLGLAFMQTPGMEVRFELLPFPTKTPYAFQGRIFYMSTVANPETHMFEAKAMIYSAPAGLRSKLKPGFSARVKLPLKTNENATLIPEESVRHTEQGTIAFQPVWRLDADNKMEWRAKAQRIEIGYQGEGWVEVLQGIEPDSWVVRRGAEALEKGTPIRFAEAHMKALQSQDAQQLAKMKAVP